MIRVVSCGDGVQGGIEECDDGNQVGGDGCSSTCTLELFTVGGTVQGLDAGETVQLSLNLSEVVLVNADGPFVFATSVAFGASYDVGFAAVPPDKECTIENGTGVMGAADVADVLVTCAPRRVRASSASCPSW